MITDEEAEKAGDWLVKNAKDYGEAKSERVYIEERLRVIRSEVFLASTGTVAEREATAFASPEYKAELESLKAAVRKESYIHASIKAAEMRIELWRSQQASLRGLR